MQHACQYPCQMPKERGIRCKQLDVYQLSPCHILHQTSMSAALTGNKLKGSQSMMSWVTVVCTINGQSCSSCSWLKKHVGKCCKVCADQEDGLTFVGRLIPATELHPGELLFSTTFMANSTALKPTAQVL